VLPSQTEVLIRIPKLLKKKKKKNLTTYVMELSREYAPVFRDLPTIILHLIGDYAYNILLVNILIYVITSKIIIVFVIKK
jgi:hypothetical protein